MCNHSFLVCSLMHQPYRLIVGIEFTVDSCAQGCHVSKGFWTAVSACQSEEGNPNSVVYVVAMKTNIDVAFGYLLRKIWRPIFSVSALEQYDCVWIHRQQQTSAALPQWFKAWKSFVHWGLERQYSRMIKQQLVYSSDMSFIIVTHLQFSCTRSRISHFCYEYHYSIMLAQPPRTSHQMP